jgi:hypothetical protein
MNKLNLMKFFAKMQLNVTTEAGFAHELDNTTSIRIFISFQIALACVSNDIVVT